MQISNTADASAVLLCTFHWDKTWDPWRLLPVCNLMYVISIDKKQLEELKAAELRNKKQMEASIKPNDAFWPVSSQPSEVQNFHSILRLNLCSFNLCCEE